MSGFPGPGWSSLTTPVNHSDLGVLREVGSGAIGTVYEVGAEPSCYYKRYSAPARHARRLDELIAWRLALEPGERDFLDCHCAWPLIAVRESDDTVGFLMRRAPDDFWADMLGEAHTLELQHLIHANAARRLGVQLPTPQQRLDLLRSFARIFDFFDQRDIVYGDVSEKNVLWTLDGTPRVFLIDCDNAHTGQGDQDAGGVAIPKNSSWRDPYLPLDGSPSLDSDRYAIAVFCYRVFYEAHAALSRDRDYVLVPPPVPGLPDLQRALGKGLGAPERRLKASDWLSAANQPPPLPPIQAPQEPGWSEKISSHLAVGRPSRLFQRASPALSLAAMAVLLGALLALLGALFVLALKTSVFAAPHRLPKPGSHEDYLAAWRAGPVKITVLHYKPGVVVTTNETQKAVGVVLARVSIRNVTSGPPHLSAAPARLVLVILNPGYSANAGLPPSARPRAGVPASLHLYSVGFMTGQWTVPDLCNHEHTAGWTAGRLNPGQTFTSSSGVNNSPAYLPSPLDPGHSITVNRPMSRPNLCTLQELHGTILCFPPLLRDSARM